MCPVSFALRTKLLRGRRGEWESRRRGEGEWGIFLLSKFK